jgi:hypothetical protein
MYPILIFSDAPEMEIVLLDRPLAPDAVYAGAGMRALLQSG